MINKTRTSVYTLTILSTIVLFLIPYISPLHAQSDSPPGKLLFTDVMLLLGGWTRDEKYITVSHSESNYEYEYFQIATKQLVKSLPSPQLSAAELSEFGIEANPPYLSPNYAISPNGVYVAYHTPAEPEDGSCAPPPHIWLANRQTKICVELPIIASNPIGFGWGSDSHHLAISGGTCEGLMPSWFLSDGYVWNISPTLADLRIIGLSDLQEIAQLQTDGSNTFLMDISSDGLWMLVAVTNWDGSRLVLVDVAHPNQSRIILDNIENFLTAELLDETPTTIIMVSATGLTELSLTGQQTVLDSSLTTTSELYDFSLYNCSDENYVAAASISPSGRWLAYIHCNGQQHRYVPSLYLLDLYALRHSNSQTPTIIPTFTPTGSGPDHSVFDSIIRPSMYSRWRCWFSGSAAKCSKASHHD